MHEKLRKGIIKPLFLLVHENNFPSLISYRNKIFSASRMILKVSVFGSSESYLTYKHSFRLAGRLRPAMPVLKQGTRKKSVTTTTYDGQKITPLLVGAQFSFWSFFIDFELTSNFFVVQEQDSRQIVCFSG